jgi:exodeoxyribonuclease VII large subunit
VDTIDGMDRFSHGDDGVWTVAELTNYIRELFEIDFRLQEMRVAGEISNFTQARSGHLYFTLKDEVSQLKCVMWRSAAQRLRFMPEEGDAVVVSGRISIYEAGGVYQMYAEMIQPTGRGDLAAAFEQLKRKLEAEGLFEPLRKKPVPAAPRKIGIVTSADAAALRDILTVLRRRWPLVSVLVAPTLVQGRDAPPQIVRALQWLDGRDDVDTIILARGGGSLEDLACFNDESLARAIAGARHCIISGVGHEVDFTIADFVADLRAPTPSAAAELSVPDAGEQRTRLRALRADLVAAMNAFLSAQRRDAQALARNLSHLSPQAGLNNSRQRVDALYGRAEQAITRLLERRQSRLALAQARLATISPLATLSRGYAIVRQEDGAIVRSAKQVGAGDRLRVQVADGEFGARAVDSL